MTHRHPAIGIGALVGTLGLAVVGTIANKQAPKDLNGVVLYTGAGQEVSFGDSDEDTKLQRSIAALKDGTLSFKAPSSMKTGERADVDAAISVGTMTGVLKGSADAQVHTVPTKVGLRMKVELKGDDFDITSVGPELQAVDGETPTFWHWIVKPKKSGKLELYLTAEAVLGDVSKLYATADEEVTVQVDKSNAVSTFLKDEWKWILTSLAAGIALVWKFFGFPTTLAGSKPVKEKSIVRALKLRRRR